MRHQWKILKKINVKSGYKIKEVRDMIKYLVDMNENDYGVVKHTVGVNDDVYVIVADKMLSTDEIVDFIGCDEDELQQIDYEDYE